MTTFDISREDVLDLAAQKLADAYGCSATIRDMVQGIIVKRVGEVLEARIEAVLSEVLERHMHETVQPVDIWGKRVGEPTTIAAACDRARDFWNARVDGSGKVMERNAYGYSSSKTRAEWMLGRVVAEEFSALVKQDAVNILAVFKEKLSADTHAAVDRHLDELIRVKSRK